MRVGEWQCMLGCRVGTVAQFSYPDYDSVLANPKCGILRRIFKADNSSALNII